MTLDKMVREITLIREAINELEIRGERNASLVLYSVRKCNEVIQAIQNAMTEKEEKRANESDSNQSE